MSAGEPRIGRYIVQGTLGQGAMGVVYLAEDPMLKRPVAVKVVKAKGAEREEALARFKHEAEISARLNHPNVVTVFDVGEEEGVGLFLTMEYVDGETLSRLLKRDALDRESTLKVLMQVMRALRAAHRMAIIHRDVKPENVLLSKEGRAKLMDFGIARHLETRTTKPGEFFGSPPYAAPELLRGQESTPATDRYAFAVSAFELYTKQFPHPGTTVSAIVSHILHEPPVLPDSLTLEQKRVFARALHHDPDERFDNLLQFVEALIDTSGLPLQTRQRLLETLDQEDHPGDVVPWRKLQQTKSGTGASSSQPMGQYVANPSLAPTTPNRSQLSGHAIRLELDDRAMDSNPSNQPSPPARKVRIAPTHDEEIRVGQFSFTWKKFIVFLIGLQIAAFLLWRLWSMFLESNERKITIRSDPPGALVFVDGSRLGTTPIPEALLKGKPKMLRFELQNHKTMEVEITQESSYQVSLEPFKQTWLLRSDPTGADVFLNGEKIGLTPLTLTPPSGRAALRVIKPGYKPFIQTLDGAKTPPSLIKLHR